jgi:hypothetical protein
MAIDFRSFLALDPLLEGPIQQGPTTMRRLPTGAQDAILRTRTD